MEIKKKTHGAVTSLKPVGPVVAEEAERVREELLQVHTRSMGRLVLDLSAMPFIDSLGLEALLTVTEELNKTGQALKLCGANEVVREVLELTDLASFFDYYADVQSAVRSFL